jgi:methionine-S-sulfoxide reductase
MEKVVFGGGCFWCTEAVFKMLKGVKNVEPGYAGGRADDAIYEKVSSGLTEHVEVSWVEYDPDEISYEQLLMVFFASHDPSMVNRQGADVGPQYRSVVFYTTEEQKHKTQKFIAEINASNPKGDKIVTEVEPLDKFYKAEKYHKDYFANNPSQAYCQIVINPKLEKVQKMFENLLKSQS